MKEFHSFYEALSIAQRYEKRKNFIKNKAKIRRGREIKRRRFAKPEALKKRTALLARNIFARKITGGKNRNQLHYAQRGAVDKVLDKRRSAILKLAKRLLPGVRKKEVERLIKVRSKAGSSLT